MHQTEYTIRDAVQTDIPAILKMHAQSWLDTYPNEKAGVTREWVQKRVDSWFTSDKLTSRAQKIKQAQDDPDMLYRVAEKDGDIAGICAAIRNEETQVVGAVYVDTRYYGTGLAQRLMDEIMAWSDPERPLELEVASYNERAKAFYRKYGFEEVEGSEHRLHEMMPVIKMIRKGDKQ